MEAPDPAAAVADAVTDVDFEPVAAVGEVWDEAVVGRMVVDLRPIPPGPNETDEWPVPMFVTT